jgi:sulfate transport system substrate-binding protein
MLGSALARLARHGFVLLTALVLAAGLAVIAAPIGAAPKDANLSLVAYSTPKDAYADLIPAFQATPGGQGVTFTQSYGASGDQARAVAEGLPADVVNLSLAPDVATLVAARLVRRDWDHQPYGGMVTNSVVVFVVRKGNPKHIKTWNDLVKPGVSVINPNPFTSGGARWNVMAAYGAQLETHKTPKQATAYLGKLYKHIAVQDKSARDALNTFLGGKGDVMLAYESEAIGAQQKGAAIDYVVPRNTILIQNPIAVTSYSGHQTEAKAFVSFLLSPKGQTIWAKHGYRPVVPSVLKTSHFLRPKGLFKITQLGLGGWPAVSSKFFDSQSGIVAKIEAGL